VDNVRDGAGLCDRGPVTPADPADVVLSPAARLLWRSPDSVQFELGSRAVVVDGLPAELVRHVAAPPPIARPARRSRPVQTTAFEPPAPAAPPVDQRTRDALAGLTEAGYLWTRGPHEQPDPRLRPPDPRLAGQLAALTVRYGAGAADVLGARRRTSVEVAGRSRAVAHIAALLGAAGVGRVHCGVDGTVRLFHAVPGGVAVADEGAVLSAAAEAAIRRAAPDVDTAPLPDSTRADLTILASDGPVPDERRDALHAANAPYLAVTLGPDSGVVGPLVLPGLTSCLQCADLHRRDRDPAWSALAVQLTVDRRPGPAGDVTVATIIAGVAAQQALVFLDGGESVCVDGTLELHLPDWRLRRRSWSMHPACPCPADGDLSGEPAG
jgi:hypothetical protein